MNPSKKEQFKVPQNEQDAPANVKKLGSKFHSVDDLKYRVQQAKAAFGTMWKIWKSKNQISQKLQLRMYDAFIKPILLYNAGANDASSTKLKIMDAAHRRHLRHIMGIYYPNIISNENLYKITDQVPISAEFTKKRWQLFGHILRLRTDVPARKVMRRYFKYQTKGHVKYKIKRRGAQRLSTIPGILAKEAKILQDAPNLFTYKDYTDWKEMAQDRKAWIENVVDPIYAHTVENIIGKSTKTSGRKHRRDEIDSAREDNNNDNRVESQNKRRRRTTQKRNRDDEETQRKSRRIESEATIGHIRLVLYEEEPLAIRIPPYTNSRSTNGM